MSDSIADDVDTRFPGRLKAVTFLGVSKGAFPGCPGKLLGVLWGALGAPGNLLDGPGSVLGVGLGLVRGRFGCPSVATLAVTAFLVA